MPETKNLGRRMTRGAAWMSSIRFAMRFIGLLNTIILARLLVPADFGLVAMAMIVVSILDLISDFSFDLALIRDQKAGPAHYDTVWTLGIIRGAFMALVLVVLAKPAAVFFANEALQTIIYFLAALTFIEGFKNSGVVDFHKDLRFDKEFRFVMGRKGTAFLVTVALAVIWRNYWALIGGLAAGRILAVVLSYRMQPYRPRLSLVEWRDLFHFSKWLLLNNMIGAVIDRAAKIIVGKLIGAHMLGVFTISDDLARLPTTLLQWPIGRSLYPGFAKVVDDGPRLAKMFRDSIALIAVLTLPLAVGILVTAEPLVRVALGSKWLESIPLVQIIALAAITQIPAAATNSIFMAINRPQIVAWIKAVRLVVGLPLLFWGASAGGAAGVAWAVVGIAATNALVRIATVVRVLEHLTFGDILAGVWRTVAAAVVMALAVGYMGGLWAGSTAFADMLARLLGEAVLGGLVYIAVLLGLWRLSGAPEGAEKHAVTFLGLSKWLSSTG